MSRLWNALRRISMRDCFPRGGSLTLVPPPLDGMTIQRTSSGQRKPHHAPLEEVEWLPAAADDHMRPDDTVVGMIVDRKAYAIPWWVMKNHHVANLVLDGTPIMAVL
jgi:hypothetical protein